MHLYGLVWGEIRIFLAEWIFFRSAFLAPKGKEQDGMLLAVEAYFRERLK